MIKKPVDVYRYCYQQGTTTTIPKDWAITNNFYWHEAFLNEQRADGVPFFDVFVRIAEAGAVFQKIRDFLGKPMSVHCWYRSIEHNVRVYIKDQGFSPAVARTKTQLGTHLYGTALDFSVAGMPDEQVRQKLVTGIREGRFKVRIEDKTTGWVHVDCNADFIFKNANLGAYNYGIFKI